MAAKIYLGGRRVWTLGKTDRTGSVDLAARVMEKYLERNLQNKQRV